MILRFIISFDFVTIFLQKKFEKNIFNNETM